MDQLMRHGFRWAIAAGVVVALSGSMPWTLGVDRKVRIRQELDAGTVWFRVCTTGWFGTCETSDPMTFEAGVHHIDLRMRFRPGRKGVTVETCDQRGCSKPVPIQAEVPVDWDLP
jgi:hypothetical protein